MSLLDFVTSFGFWFGIDFLFWAWAIVTVVAFLNVFIPDPIPFIDEFLLIVLSLVLLFMLAARDTAVFFGSVFGVLSHPALLGFVITIVALVVGGVLFRNMRDVK